jgi:hypothetical protein
MRRSVALLSFLAAGVAVSGCTLVSTSSAPAPKTHHRAVQLCSGGTTMGSLVITRHLLNPGTFPFPATVHVSGATAERVVDAICSLRAEPTGWRSCPIDLGPTYELTFTTTDGRTATVTTDPTGCATVSSPTRSIGTKGFGVRASDAHFWGALGVAVGVPHATQRTFAGTTSSS